MRHAIVCSSALVLAAASAAGAANGPTGPAAIRAADLRRHVEYLAADALLGRDTGEPGVARAEDYIAEQFRSAGLVTVPETRGAFLDFTLWRESYDLARTTLEIDLGTRKLTARAGVDFRPFGFSDTGAVEAPVVFAGYGISAPELDHDDYAGLAVEGAIVLVLRHEPQEDDPASRFDGVRHTGHAQFDSKAANAAKHGAVGMLLVTDPLNHEEAEDLRLRGRMSLERADGAEGAADEAATPFLAAHIAREVAEAIVAGSGDKSLTQLQQALDRGTPAAQLPALARVRARISIERAAEPEAVPARNVAAFVPGSDPALRDEWILIGAHHDHVGGVPSKGDTIFNGADDNASGTSGVLELAQAFAAGPKTRRSLVFVTFTGEEQGLFGSRALVAQHLVPVDRVVFMLNLDMIGRNPDRAIDVVGDGYVSGLREVVEAANRADPLALQFGGADYAGNSDHDPFYETDVPFLFFFTGIHDDYHQPGDHADKLDYRRMQRILRLAYGVVERLGNADARPRFVHHVSWLGTRVEIEAVPGAVPAAVVRGVEDGSRAALAGIRVGDVIAAFGETALDEAEQVGQRFRDIAPGDGTTLVVQRDGERVAIPVQRAKTGYLGVSPGEVDEDLRKLHGLHSDEGIVVRSLVADGPLAAGGAQVGDVLLSLGGRRIGPGNLSSRLAQIGAGETVAIEVLRGRERLKLEVTLGERPERR